MSKIPETPLFAPVKGKSGKEYLFEAYNIDDKFPSDNCGVYIFTKKETDNRITPPFKHSHVFLSFTSIATGIDNTEIIKTAQNNGAKHFFHYSSAAEYQRKEIIEDIKMSDDYKYQLDTFPELTP